MTSPTDTNTVEEEVAIHLINWERRCCGFKPIKIKTMKSKHADHWQEYLMKAQIAVGAVNHYWGKRGL